MSKVQSINAAGKRQVINEAGIGTITKNSYSEAVTLAAAKTSTSTSQTGFITGSSSSGNTLFNTVWWNSGGLVVWQSAGRQTTVNGYEGSLGQVEGVSVRLIDTYDPFNNGNRSMDVQISLDGGNNYSTAINSGNLGNTSTTDITVGGKNNTWGLTWPSTFDVSNFRVKGTSVNGIVYSKQAQVNFKHSTTTTTEDVDITVSKNDGSDVTDSTSIVWDTNVFNSLKGDTWQLHTTGSHGNAQLYMTSQTYGWNFIVHNWPEVETKFNSKTDGDGNTITVNKKLKSWR